MQLCQENPVLHFAGIETAFRRDVLNGLATRPRNIPARWFHHRIGYGLCKEATALPECYVTRTEQALLRSVADEVAALAGPASVVVEFGAGACIETSNLLSAMSPAAYVPIDISRDVLLQSAKRLSKICPDMPLYPIEADFTRALPLPAAIEGVPRLGFFPASTIGNLPIPAAVELLRVMAATLGNDSLLLIGIDRVNDPDNLLPAYNNAQSVTAAFNLNLLHRINRELAGSVPVHAFRHFACWNGIEARIEMHLEAAGDVDFSVEGRQFSMSRGETIHTENVLKYGPREACLLLRAGGWIPIADWTDPEQRVSLILAVEGPAP